MSALSSEELSRFSKLRDLLGDFHDAEQRVETLRKAVQRLNITTSDMTYPVYLSTTGMAIHLNLPELRRLVTEEHDRAIAKVGSIVSDMTTMAAECLQLSGFERTSHGVVVALLAWAANVPAKSIEWSEFDGLKTIIKLAEEADEMAQDDAEEPERD